MAKDYGSFQRAKDHNAVGALDRLGVDARLKRNTVFLKLSLPKGKRIQKLNGQYRHDITESLEEIVASAPIFNLLEEDDDLEDYA